MISMNDFRKGFMVEEGKNFKSLNLRFNDATICDWYGLCEAYGITASIDESFLKNDNTQSDLVNITFDIEFGFYDFDEKNEALLEHIEDFKEVAKAFMSGNPLASSIGVTGNYDFLDFTVSMSHLVRCIQTEILQQNFDDWIITGAKVVENNYNLWREDSSEFNGKLFNIRTSAEVRLK